MGRNRHVRWRYRDILNARRLGASMHMSTWTNAFCRPIRVYLKPRFRYTPPNREAAVMESLVPQWPHLVSWFSDTVRVPLHAYFFMARPSCQPTSVRPAAGADLPQTRDSLLRVRLSLADATPMTDAR